MIKLICLAENEAQLREKLKLFDALDLTLFEKGAVSYTHLVCGKAEDAI